MNLSSGKQITSIPRSPFARSGCVVNERAIGTYGVNQMR
jgi:hypothetical protein